MLKTIGNTPMVKINYEYEGKEKYTYVKLEYYNLTGSIKDIVAYYIINNVYKRGDLKKKMPIVESTSGNTGISISALGAFYKHPVFIFMPDWASKERIDLMKNYGANLIRKLPGTDLKNSITGETIYTPPQNEQEIRKYLKNLEDFINNNEDGIDPLIKVCLIHLK